MKASACCFLLPPNILLTSKIHEILSTFVARLASIGRIVALPHIKAMNLSYTFVPHEARFHWHPRRLPFYWKQSTFIIINLEHMEAGGAGPEQRCFAEYPTRHALHHVWMTRKKLRYSEYGV